MTARMLLVPIVLAAAIAFVGCSSSADAPPSEQPEDVPPINVPPEDLKALVDGNNQFAIDLYKKLAEKETGNIVFSPYSISSALAMTYAGARGQTAEEMAKVLHFTLPQEKLHPAFGGTTNYLKASGRSGSHEVAIANSVWKQRGFGVERAFAELMERSYGGGLQETDFANDPSGSRRAINAWADENTRGRIKELLVPQDIDRKIRMVLVNAIYFQGKWKQQFDKAKTRDDDFEIAPGQKVRVPMMAQGDVQVRFAEAETFTLLELPYKGERWGMVFLMPKKRGGLREVEAQLTGALMDSALARLKSAVSALVIPRFTVHRNYRLKPELVDLGMPMAFSPAADFTGMSQGAELSIAQVIHGASIEVDETGTVAAAATAVTMHKISAPKEVRIDQPFILMIVDKQSRSIAFFGRINDPR